MEYRKKSWFCSLLAALCLLSALPRMESLARGAVDTGAVCTLSVKMTLNKPEGDWEDLEKAEISVRICRVAGMDAVGGYQEAEGFEALYTALSGLQENPEKADAAFWRTQAEAAAETFDALSEEEGGVPEGIFTAAIAVKDGAGSLGGLPVGLYLVYPEEVQTAAYIYTFEPYLVSLPDNAYGRDAGDGGVSGTADEWNYEVEAGLKPERSARSGDVLIEKTLLRHNASLGPAVFVFQVDAFRDQDGDGTAETVYSNVVSLSFDKAGTRQTLVKGLPAGAEVRVREVYSGSAYETASGSGKEQTVTVRPSGEETDGSDSTVKVTFVNDYNNSLTPGTGITNRFTWEEGWRWEKITHSLAGDTVEKGGDGGEQDEA